MAPTATKQTPKFGQKLRKLRERRLGKRSSVRAAAELLGLKSGTTVWRYEQGQQPDIETVWRMSKAYSASFDELFRDLVAEVTDGAYTPAPSLPAAPDGFGAVPLMKGRIAAGHALVIEDGEYAGALAFNAKFLRQWRQPVCVRVGDREESMMPLILPGDVVLLECDTSGLERPDPGAVYAVRVDGGSTLKRVDLVRERGHAWLALLSENPDKRRYPVRMIAIEDGAAVSDHLIGRVVWHGQQM